MTIIEGHLDAVQVGHLDEAVVHAQAVLDGGLPGGPPLAIVGELLNDVLAEENVGLMSSWLHWEVELVFFLFLFLVVRSTILRRIRYSRSGWRRRHP